MLGHLRSCRRGLCFFAGVAPLSLSLVFLPGCGDGADTAKPVGDIKAQQKKAADYNKNYRDQIIAANKEKAKAKTAPGKPAETPEKSHESPTEK